MKRDHLGKTSTLVASFFVYLPFARSVDQEYYAMEQGQEEA